MGEGLSAWQPHTGPQPWLPYSSCGWQPVKIRDSGWTVVPGKETETQGRQGSEEDDFSWGNPQALCSPSALSKPMASVMSLWLVTPQICTSVSKCLPGTSTSMSQTCPQLGTAPSPQNPVPFQCPCPHGQWGPTPQSRRVGQKLRSPHPPPGTPLSSSQVLAHFNP